MWPYLQTDQTGAAIDQSAELYADEADELAAFVHFSKEFLDNGPKIFIECGVTDLTLAAESIEVGVANFDGDDGTEFAGVSQFEGQFSVMSSSSVRIRFMSRVSCSKVRSLEMDLASW